MDYKKLAVEAIGLLLSEYEEQFDDLNERGEVSDNGKNYEDARSDWADEQVCRYLSLDRKTLDKILHGEI